MSSEAVRCDEISILDRDAVILAAGELENAPPEAVLRWALESWRHRLAIFTSFQAESMVILDMAWRIDPGVRVVTLDTGRLPQETHDMIERVRERYGIEVEIHFPDARAVAALVRRSGPNLFYHSVENRLDCCRVRKVEPLERALAGLDAWVTGLRREQSPARAEVRTIAIDDDHGGIVKLSPLAEWSWRQVEEYTRTHNVPRHPLYAQGYTSIGCAPCTRPVGAEEDSRAGRWWWEQGGNKECGLHMTPAGPAAASRLPIVTVGPRS